MEGHLIQWVLRFLYQGCQVFVGGESGEMSILHEYFGESDSCFYAKLKSKTFTVVVPLAKLFYFKTVQGEGHYVLRLRCIMVQAGDLQISINLIVVQKCQSSSSVHRSSPPV